MFRFSRKVGFGDSVGRIGFPSGDSNSQPAPLDLGAIAWWDARDPNNIDTSGSLVNSWTDRIGNRVVSATGSDRPNWNGSDGILFGGATERLVASSVDSTLAALHSTGSLFIRFSVEGSGRYVLVDTQDFDNTGIGATVSRDNNGTWNQEFRARIYTLGAGSDGIISDIDDTGHSVLASDGIVNCAYTVDGDNEEVTHYVKDENGVTRSFNAAAEKTDDDPNRPIAIGGRATVDNLFHEGLISQVVIFDKVLSSSEIDQLRDWADDLDLLVSSVDYEDGLTVDTSRTDDTTISSTDLDRNNSVYVVADVTLGSNAEGVIWEQGGSSLGSFLGITSNALVWRCGNGASPPSSIQARAVYTDFSTEYANKRVLIHAEWDLDEQTCRVWVQDNPGGSIDGAATLLAEDSTSGITQYTGGDQGAFGTEGGSSAISGESTGIDWEDATGSSLHELRIYNTQRAPKSLQGII